MPFRNLMSWTGQGGSLSPEPDQNGGLWRNITPPSAVLAAAAYALTSEDVMRGVVVNTLGCVYTVPTAAHLLADYPDWPVGATVSLGIFSASTSQAKGFAASTGTTLAVGLGVNTSLTGACFLLLWRDSDTTFKYLPVRALT